MYFTTDGSEAVLGDLPGDTAGLHSPRSPSPRSRDHAVAIDRAGNISKQAIGFYKPATAQVLNAPTGLTATAGHRAGVAEVWVAPIRKSTPVTGYQVEASSCGRRPGTTTPLATQPAVTPDTNQIVIGLPAPRILLHGDARTAPGSATPQARRKRRRPSWPPGDHQHGPVEERRHPGQGTTDTAGDPGTSGSTGVRGRHPDTLPPASAPSRRDGSSRPGHRLDLRPPVPHRRADRDHQPGPHRRRALRPRNGNVLGTSAPFTLDGLIRPYRECKPCGGPTGPPHAFVRSGKKVASPPVSPPPTTSVRCHHLRGAGKRAGLEADSQAASGRLGTASRLLQARSAKIGRRNACCCRWRRSRRCADDGHFGWSKRPTGIPDCSHASRPRRRKPARPGWCPSRRVRWPRNSAGPKTGGGPSREIRCDLDEVFGSARRRT